MLAVDVTIGSRAWGRKLPRFFLERKLEGQEGIDHAKLEATAVVDGFHYLLNEKIRIKVTEVS